jgi:hypothetical protein
MAVPARPLAVVTHDAISALFREIGIAETVRFLHQFSLGRGDYTRERAELFGERSLADILGEIRRQGGGPRTPGTDR